MTELQAKFEAKFTQDGKYPGFVETYKGQYVLSIASLAWQWAQWGAQASTATLPTPISRDDTVHGVDYYTAEQMCEAIAQASITSDTDVNAPWLSLAHSICTDSGIGQGHIYARLCALRDKQSGNGRSDQQIVDETEKLAKALAEYDGWQSTMPFKDAINPRAQGYWNRACLAQEILTATDVTDAVDALDGEPAPE